MDLHNLPAELDLQHPPTNMNGSFETVTAQQNDNKASGNTTDTVDEQQHAPPIDDRLQALYNTYHTSYAFPISPHSSHKQHASDLAAALLQRHYPLPQYRVERCALGPITKYGINFMLKDDDEPDSDIDLPKVKKAKTSANKKRTADVDPTWHIINHEDMSAFVVKKGAVEVVDGIRQTLVWRPCTYLVIVLDDLSTFPRWSRDTLNHRGDVLSDLSGVVGGMQRGHGMLFFGPRLELYGYDANDAHHPVKPWANTRWRMDMRNTSLAEVDEVVRNFARLEPVYEDGH